MDKLKAYINKPVKPKRFHSAAEAMFLLTSNAVVKKELKALSDSIQADHKNFLTTNELSGILNTYLERSKFSDLRMHIKQEREVR